MKSYRNCLRVGITGGIGSGKSTVCRMFEHFGIPVYDADYWAKWLIVNDHSIKERIVMLLGDESYHKNGSYNRAYVAGIVFGDKEKLKGLNAIVHPAVEQHSLQWHDEKAKSGKYPYTLKEAALLIESGGYRHLDYLIVVVAPEADKIERVMQRDKATEAQVRSVIQNQLPDEERIKLAGFVIQNETLADTQTQVEKVHHELLLHSF